MNTVNNANHQVQTASLTRAEYKGNPLNDPNLDPAARANIKAMSAMNAQNLASQMAITAQRNKYEVAKLAVQNSRF